MKKDMETIGIPQMGVIGAPMGGGTGSGGGGGTGAVDSVNGKTGVVVLNATDVGAASVAQVQSVADDVATNTQGIAALQAVYEGLTQSDIVPLASLPASGEANTIYRIAGADSYSDYMWDGSDFVLMATYDNAIDDVPTLYSNNLAKSGGIYDAIQGNVVTKSEFTKSELLEITSNGASGFDVFHNVYTIKNNLYKKVIARVGNPTSEVVIAFYRGNTISSSTFMQENVVLANKVNTVDVYEAEVPTGCKLIAVQVRLTANRGQEISGSDMKVYYDNDIFAEHVKYNNNYSHLSSTNIQDATTEVAVGLQETSSMFVPSIGRGTYAQALSFYFNNPARKFCWIWDEIIEEDTIFKPIFQSGEGVFIDAIGARINLDPKFVFTIQLTADNSTEYVPVYPQIGVGQQLSVDWGDGSEIEEYSGNEIDAKTVSHQYSGDAGDRFTIVVRGNPYRIWFTSACCNLASIVSLNENTLMSRVVIGAAGGTAIQNLSNLESIANGIFNNLAQSDRLWVSFKSLGNLTYIGDDVLDRFTLSTVVNTTFQNDTKLKYLPRSLKHAIRNCTKVESLGTTGVLRFHEDMFNEIQDGTITSFSGCFDGCTKADNDAYKLYSVMKDKAAVGCTTTNCFRNCTNMSNRNKVPASWGGTGN